MVISFNLLIPDPVFSPVCYKMEQTIWIASFILLLMYSCKAEEIHTTEVFIMTIEPWFFNWSDSEDSSIPSQFSYRPSLLNASELPSWMYYTYSEEYSTGFVYGAPPLHQEDFQIEVVGLNKEDYEARSEVIEIDVIEKAEPALYEVYLKVDKLNVVDILNSDRYNELLDVFRKSLWPDSQDDLYITFLASAVQLGARLPLNPTEGEGIVMHIGSRTPFSQMLLDLQKEVQPLHSKGQTNCPDFKHTSVERFFKQYDFSLDWCAFQLIERQLSQGPPQKEKADINLADSYPQTWNFVSREELPTRHYLSELGFTLIVPVFCFVLLVALLTFILCFQQDPMEESPTGAIIGSILVAFEGLVRKRNEETPQSLLMQYEAVQRASNTLRSLSTLREHEDPGLGVSMESSGLRPNPPPYSGVHSPDRDEFLDEEEAKTWYC